LGVNLDPREIYKAGEDYSEVISKLGKKIVHTHIRDYPSPEQEPALPEEQILGRGKIDYPLILKNLKKVAMWGAFPGDGRRFYLSAVKADGNRRRVPGLPPPLFAGTEINFHMLNQ